jgi:RNA polymerase sigma-70 factor (ECF subfamily)
MSDDFASQRPRLLAIAYRMLGSASDAEDVVQEAWIRWEATPKEEVRSPAAFLVTMVTRLCIDHLGSARVRREEYPGPWLPEPVRTEEVVDPATISLAFLVLLEQLSPSERAVYLLSRVFDYSHAEVGAILGKEEAACRQLFHRAKEHIASGQPRFAATREQHQRLFFGFLKACSEGDLAGLTAVLADDVTHWSDGGGKVPTAARRPIRGVDAVARFFLGLMRHRPADLASEIAEINGETALVLRAGGKVDSVLTVETNGEKIVAIRWIANPDKLAHLERPS